MINLNIKGARYSLPQTHYEITHTQGLKIRELEKVFGGINYGYKVNVLEMLSGCDRLKEVVKEEINTIYDHLPLFSDKVSVQLPGVVLMNEKRYGLVDLDNISLQEYMDIEQLFNNTDDYYSIASSLSAILYRPISVVKHSFTTRILNLRLKTFKTQFIKPYAHVSYNIEDYNLNASGERVEEVEECFSWGHCLSCLSYYLNWKNKLAEKFYLVFPKSDKEEEQANTQEKKILGIGEIWGMYHQLALMTDRNLKEIDYYESRPVMKVMKHLSYCVQDNRSKLNK